MTKARGNIDFLSYFDEIEDPRIDRKKFYPLSEILLIMFCGTICGAESWRDFVDFGESRLEYLRRFSPLTNVIPSKNTFSRVISNLNPESFKNCFANWVSALQENMGNVIAIDGKAILQ